MGDPDSKEERVQLFYCLLLGLKQRKLSTSVTTDVSALGGH